MQGMLKQSAEVTVFGGLAVLLLIAGFVAWPRPGLQSGGAGGYAQATISATSATIAKMVQQWERAVETATIQPVETPKLTTEFATAPKFELAQAPTAQVQIGLPPQTGGDLPGLESDVTEAPAEPREQETRVTPRAKPAPSPERQLQQSASSRQGETENKAGQASLRAAGANGGGTAGQARHSDTIVVGDDAENAKLRLAWGARIKSKIRRAQKYPRRAEGVATVVVKLVIDINGRLVSYRIVKSSGQALFDEAAVRAIKSIRRYPKAPRGYTDGMASFQHRIEFER